MRSPNLFIIGAQKCGTTWLHEALAKSVHFHGSHPKEVNYWNKTPLPDFNGYQEKFLGGTGVEKYVYESTPHYFRLPGNASDNAKRISEKLGEVEMLLLVRNPVDRFLSAYTHNMMGNRIPYIAELTEVPEGGNLLQLGCYGTILEHFSTYFPNIKIYSYDDLVKDQLAFVRRIFSDLSVEFDLSAEDLNFRANDKNIKGKKLDIEKMPELSPKFTNELRDFYRPEVEKLEKISGLNFEHWK